MRHDSQHGMTSLTRLLAVGATLLLSALPAEPASFAYARSRSIVYVIDTANPSIVARIPIGAGFGGTPAVDPSETRVYTANFSENTVAVVDIASRTVIGQIPVSHPAIVLMHPSGRVAYVSGVTIVDRVEAGILVNRIEAGLLAVIDTTTNTVIATIPFPVSRPRGVLMHPSGRVAYVSGSTIVDGVETGFLAAIDTTTNMVITIPMGPGFLPISMILHPAGTKLYVSNFIDGPGGKVVVIDTSTHAVVTTVPVVRSGALVAHPAGTFVYVINSNGVSVLDTVTDTVVATIPASQLPPSPQKMVVHPSGTFLYVIAGINRTFSTPSGNVAVVDTRTNRVVATIPLPSLIPLAAALIPSGTRLYVPGDVPASCTRPLDCVLLQVKLAGTVVIDTTTNTVLTTVPPGPFRAGGPVTVDPSGHSVYANNGGLSVIDASTNAVTATLPPADVVFGAIVPVAPDVQVFYTIRSLDAGQQGTQWGAPGDRPVPADYDGDGRADVAIFRPREAGQEGVWWIQRSSDGGIVREQWGAVTDGDQPVPADYDGDGKADLAVWRLEEPSITQGVWFILRSSDGRVVTQQWGTRDDLPVPADYDGDGRTDIAVWRPSVGTWFVISSRDSAGSSQQLGVGTDVPVPADYDGDGRTDIAVWRPSTGEWFVMSSRTSAVTSVAFGAPGDVPVPRDYDGDGKADVAIWRPSTGEWFILRSSDGRVVAQQWGARGDLPTPADFDGDRAADLTVYRP